MFKHKQLQKSLPNRETANSRKGKDKSPLSKTSLESASQKNKKFLNAGQSILLRTVQPAEQRRPSGSELSPDNQEDNYPILQEEAETAVKSL